MCETNTTGVRRGTDYNPDVSPEYDTDAPFAENKRVATTPDGDILRGDGRHRRFATAMSKVDGVAHMTVFTAPVGNPRVRVWYAEETFAADLLRVADEHGYRVAETGVADSGRGKVTFEREVA